MATILCEAHHDIGFITRMAAVMLLMYSRGRKFGNKYRITPIFLTASKLCVTYLLTARYDFDLVVRFKQFPDIPFPVFAYDHCFLIFRCFL